MYGPDHVVKISSLSSFLGKKLHAKLVRDHAICKKYFTDFVVETVDVTPVSGVPHTEIQPYIQGEMLRREHLRNPTIRAQFDKVVGAMMQMKEDGCPQIDLIGNGGVFKQRLSNIIIDTNNALHIIDTTLYEAKSVGPFGRVLEILIPLATMRQKYLLWKFSKQN